MKGCVGCVETERMGLLQLKSYFNSLHSLKEESFLHLWSDDDHKKNCCTWVGVQCSDGIGGHIVDLSLNNLDWTDQIALNLSLLQSFPKLNNLDFSSNGFSHLFDPIRGYKSFQTLENLEIQDLSGNYLNNSVLLFLSETRSLMVLRLSENRLKGVFPPKGYSKLCGLKNLRELDLSYNALTSMPYCLGNLSRLQILDLTNNQMNGDLSAFVSGLPSALEYVSLLRNSFNSSFLFSSLVNQTRLKVFLFSSKVGMIQAQAESFWVPLFQLKVLKLLNFILGSTVPHFLHHHHDLWYVDLSHNKLAGSFPTWLVQNNTRLQTLLLHSNSLTKLQLPRIVHGLQALDISSNMIYDSIQEDIGIFFPKLRLLNFSSNYFHGTIPSSTGKLESLETLDVSSNNLSGQLSKMLSSGWYSMKYLKLSNNQFHGKMFLHESVTGLAVLLLGLNYFTGCIGKSLTQSKSLQYLDISDNRLSGNFPRWIERISTLFYINLSGHQLKGSFPHNLQSDGLQVLDMSHNSFSGSIPRNVSFSSGLYVLRLQNNEFSGSIPDTLFKFEELMLLDLRNNNISGKIPNIIGESSTLLVLLLRNNSLESHILRKYAS